MIQPGKAQFILQDPRVREAFTHKLTTEFHDNLSKQYGDIDAYWRTPYNDPTKNTVFDMNAFSAHYETCRVWGDKLLDYYRGKRAEPRPTKKNLQAGFTAEDDVRLRSLLEEVLKSHVANLKKALEEI